MLGTECEAALVSTNSICQGQQVAPLWKPLVDGGIKINFAHRTFTWTNEAAHQASVFCVIVGFSYQERKQKLVWDYRRATKDERIAGAPREVGVRREVANLNGYLADAPNVFLTRRAKPICDVPDMERGNQPTDGGNLLFKKSEIDPFLELEPQAAEFIRQYSMGGDYINNKTRYCLWLNGIAQRRISSMPLVLAKIQRVKEMREGSLKAATRKKAATPWLFDEIRYEGEGTYIAIPKVSSARRRYIPLGFVEDGMIPGDKLYFIPTDSLYVFGVMISQFHNAWMRVVAGRLKSDYSYGNTTVYNNFVWPEVSEGEQDIVEKHAQAVLDARGLYPEATLADMYNPDNDFLYPELMKAHHDLDAAVEKAYGVDFSKLEDTEREQAIVAHLFELYNAKVAE